MDIGPGPRSTHGVDGPRTSIMARLTSDGHDALHLEGQLDTSVCRCYFDGVGELALCFITSGTAGGTKGVSKWILWRCSIFLSESDAVLHRGVNCGPRVDGGLLHPITNEMVTGRRAGQVALGHVSIVFLFELSRAVRRLSGGFTLGRPRSDPDVTTHHDAVHGLRAAPEPDATLRETFKVSESPPLVEQDLPHVKFPPYQRKRYASTQNVRHPHGPGHGLLPGVVIVFFSDIITSWCGVLPLSY